MGAVRTPVPTVDPPAPPPSGRPARARVPSARARGAEEEGAGATPPRGAPPAPITMEAEAAEAAMLLAGSREGPSPGRGPAESPAPKDDAPGSSGGKKGKPGSGAAAGPERAQTGQDAGPAPPDPPAKKERKKGVPWTEAEHQVRPRARAPRLPRRPRRNRISRLGPTTRLTRRGAPSAPAPPQYFLAGLAKLGKGDWRGISRHFVRSRTPTQVASHAQKYFIRQQNNNKRKRRASLFDTVLDESVPLPPAPAPLPAAEASARPASRRKKPKSPVAGGAGGDPNGAQSAPGAGAAAPPLLPPMFPFMPGMPNPYAPAPPGPDGSPPPAPPAPGAIDPAQLGMFAPWMFAAMMAGPPLPGAAAYDTSKLFRPVAQRPPVVPLPAGRPFEKAVPAEGPAPPKTLHSGSHESYGTRVEAGTMARLNATSGGSSGNLTTLKSGT